MEYSDNFDPGGDPALAHELLERMLSFIEGPPGWRYLNETRGLPRDAILYSASDLRLIEPPIPGFDRLAYGVASLLRDPKSGDITGFQITGCGPGGERLVDKSGRTVRKAFTLTEHGCRDALFMVKATGARPMIAYAVEGRLEKVIAVAAVFNDPAIHGWGGRGSLGRAIPPEPTVVVIEDVLPADSAEAEQHVRQMERGVDDLLLAGKSVLRAGPPPCGCCKDVDAALGKHPIEELRSWLTSAAPAALSLDGEARRCAKLKDPLRRGQAIKDVIDRHGLRKGGMVTAFREQVAKYGGGKSKEDEDEDRAADAAHPEVLPWAYPVNGAAVLDEVVDTVKRYILLPDVMADAIALWAAFSHGLELFWFNPRLALCSPVKRCGKTTLVEVLKGLVARPKPTSGVTPSVVCRMIDKWHPTYLIDEADGYLPENEQLRSVLNSGHTPTAAFVDRHGESG
jgi:hypothetical protein